MALTPAEEQELQMLQAQLPMLQEQFAQLQASQAPAPAAAPAPEVDPQYHGYWGEDGKPNRLDKFKHGLGLSAIETAMGVKSLFTELSPENKAVLEMMREDAKRMGGWATAGEVAGEVAQLAVPASKIGKASKLAGRGAPAAFVAGETALGAGHGALTAGAKEDTTRGEGAILGGAGALAGAGAGKVLGKAMEGIKKTDAAQYLIDQGVKLTPAQASDSGLVKTMEHMMHNAPFFGKSVRLQREAAEDSFNLAAIKEAAPLGMRDKMTEGGQKGVAQLKQAFDDSYDEAWDMAKQPTYPELANTMIRASATYDELGAGAGRIANKTFDALRRIEVDGGPKAMRDADKMLRKEAQRAFDSQDFVTYDAIETVRGDIMNMAGDAAKKSLDAVNSKYNAFRTMREAASALGPMERGQFGAKGQINPTDLNKAIRSVAGATPTGRNRLGTGTADMQQFAEAGVDTLGQPVPVPQLDWWRRHMAGAAPTFGMHNLILNPAANAVMGRTAVQTHTRTISDILRKYTGDAAAPTVGAALAEE